MRNLEALIREALGLSTDQRARLAERLLESLDNLPDEELERLWVSEALRRVEGYRSGKIEARPAAKVHEELRRHLR
jgi:putative addiction module component (TIGR02574 family)